MGAIIFSLRPWQLSDAESLVKYGNNINVAKNLTNQFPHPYTLNDAHKFISFASQQIPERIFAIEINSEAVGGIGIHPQVDIQSKNAELGYWLGEPFWGKGIIQNAIQRILPIAFNNFDVERVFARPFGTNIGSIKVLEKNNFVKEAHFKNTLFKNGQFLDELYFGITKSQWDKNK